MIIDIRLRTKKDRSGLIDLIISSFGDSRTSAEDGSEYLSRDAKEYFGVNLEDEEWYDVYLDEELMYLTTDNYIKEVLETYSETASEIDLVNAGYELYKKNHGDYYEYFEYEVNVDRNDRVLAIAVVAN